MDGMSPSPPELLQRHIAIAVSGTADMSKQ